MYNCVNVCIARKICHNYNAQIHPTLNSELVVEALLGSQCVRASYILA
jgi:hypothetical protein